MLVSQHLCNVVFSGATGAPDICSSSAADPGADRWLSMVTSTIDETVTLLRERILFFFFRHASDSTGGRATVGRTSDSTGGRATFDCGDSTAVVFCLQLVLEDTFFELGEELRFACESASDSTGGRPHSPPDDRDARTRSVLEHHDNRARVRDECGTPCL